MTKDVEVVDMSLQSSGDELTSSKPRKWKCSFPWQQVIIDVLGNVHPCCHWSGNEPCGNINQQSLREIWNGEVFQKLRAGMAADDLEAAGCANCMVMKQSLWQGFAVNEGAIDKDEDYRANIEKNYEEYSAGKEVLDVMPTRISYSGRAACNLECYYCYQNNHKSATIKNAIWETQIEPLLPVATEIIWGGGEPLIQKEFMRFLAKTSEYPHLKFSTTTNGLPVKEEYLKRLEALGSVNIHLSIDAGTADTYRTHRIGGEFSDLLDVLKLLVKYRDKNLDNWRVSWGFLAMRTTIHEMATAIEKARELTIPISLGPIETYPMEERLDFYNDWKTETKDFDQYIEDAYDANRRHLETMSALAKDDPRYSAHVSDAEMNIRYIHQVIQEAIAASRDEFKTARIFGQASGIPEALTGRLRLTVYTRDDSGNANGIAGFSVLDADGTIDFRVEPGTYNIGLELKWGYGYGDHIVLEKGFEFVDGINYVDVFFPHIAWRAENCFDDNRMVAFGGKLGTFADTDAEATSRLDSDRQRALTLTNCDSGYKFVAQLDRATNFNVYVPAGRYVLECHELAHDSRRDVYSTNVIYYLPEIDLRLSRHIEFELVGGTTYFRDSSGTRIATQCIAEDPNYSDDAVRAEAALNVAKKIKYSGSIQTEGHDSCILQIANVRDLSVLASRRVRSGGTFNIEINAGTYQHEILTDGSERRVLLFLGGLDLQNDRFMSIDIRSDGSSYLRDEAGVQLQTSEILMDPTTLARVFENPSITNSRILFVGNIANNAYNSVKFLRSAGIDSSVLIYDYRHIMGQPEWEDAEITGPPLDENSPEWESVELNGFRRPDWFKSVVSSHFWKTERSEKLESIWKKVAIAMAYAGNRSWLLRQIPGYWDGYNKLMDRHRSKFARNTVKRLIADYNRQIYGKVNNERLTEEEVLEYFGMSHTHDAMYANASLLVLCDYNPIWGLFQERPYIAFEHGTLRDVPFGNSAMSKLLALAYHNAKKVIITNCDNITAAKKLGLENYHFIPHPVDTVKFRPGVTERSGQIRSEIGSKYLIFAPARHNWKFEPDKGLSVYKGNDRMVLSMHRVKEEGIDAKLVFCDWGQEQQLTKDLVRQEGLEDYVEWVPPVGKMQLVDYMNAADVVMDQFSIGTFGTTCVEAMACAKPVLIHLDKEVHEWAFEEIPPVCNVQEISDIGDTLIRLLKDETFAKNCGQQNLDWVTKYHSPEVVVREWQKVLGEVGTV